MTASTPATKPAASTVGITTPIAATAGQPAAVTVKTGAAADSAVKPVPTNPNAAPPFVIESGGNRTRYLKLLVYGQYGVGKTWLMGTAVAVEALRDVLLISAEAGDLTLYDPDGQIPFHHIDMVTAKSYKEVARVHDFLKLHCTFRDRTDDEATTKLRGWQNMLLRDAPDADRLRRYRTVIIDSLTEVEHYCMYQLLGVDGNVKIDEEVQGAEWAEYKKQHVMVQRLIRGFRDLPMNVLFTCAEQFREDELKRNLYSPQMTGKLSGQVQGFMDMVGRLVMGQVEDGKPAPRRLLIAPGPRHQAKSRFSAYRAPHFDNPTIESIMRSVGLLGAPGAATKA